MENEHPVVAPHSGKATDRERILGAISYLGPLFIVSYLMAENSKFIKYHASQGLAFFLAALVIRYGLGALMMAVFVPSVMVGDGRMAYGGMGVIGFIIMLINLAILAVGIIAIVKAAQGETWEMPVIGPLAKKLNL